MKIKNCNENKTTPAKIILKANVTASTKNKSYCNNFSIPITLKIIFLIFLCQIKLISSKPQEKKANVNTNNNNKNPSKHISKIPDDLETHFKFIDNKSRECFNEIVTIFKRDFKDSFTNPYKVLNNQEKFLNRTINQISKKLNKYNFYEAKNFTGIRWINPKYFSGEVKKLVENYFHHIAEYFEKKFFNCKSSVPEFIIENYLFFFTKFNEVKKVFQKFNLFKGIKKYMKCLTKTNSSYSAIHFGENLLIGKITIKKMLTNLKNIVTASLEIIKGSNVEAFAKLLKKIINNLKGYPVL